MLAHGLHNGANKSQPRTYRVVLGKPTKHEYLEGPELAQFRARAAGGPYSNGLWGDNKTFFHAIQRAHRTCTTRGPPPKRESSILA